MENLFFIRYLMVVSYRRNTPNAFTLVELLVVIGIIAVLISILLPTIGRAKESATKTVCASQLRQLVAASVMYQNEFRLIPPPTFLLAINSNAPSGITEKVLNSICRELRVRDVTPSSTLDQLPVVTVCPFRKNIDLFKSANFDFGTPYWITGYLYTGRCLEKPNQLGTAILSKRIADARGSHRAVMWADTLMSTSTSGTFQGYSAFHVRGAQLFNPTFGTIMSSSPIQGQHRGWSDGSVEWLNRSEIDLAPERRTSSATYQVSVPGAFELWYYF